VIDEEEGEGGRKEGVGGKEGAVDSLPAVVVGGGGEENGKNV